jgi:hypothetical protein
VDCDQPDLQVVPFQLNSRSRRNDLSAKLLPAASAENRSK